MVFAQEWRLRAEAAQERWRPLEHVLAVAVIAALSAGIAFWNIDYPMFIHPDEYTKVWFASGNGHNYNHPPLLIIAARFLAWIAGASSEFGVALSGRSVSALAAVGASLLFHSLLRHRAGGLDAFLWSAVFATSPAIAVHAHYFKEDAVLVFSILVGLHALQRLTRRAGLADLIYFGFALGLADTAKYVGAINSFMLFFFAIAYCRLSLRQVAVVCAAVAATVVLVFVLSFASEVGSGLSTLLAGLAYEWQHVAAGHDLKEWFQAGYGLTHIRHHLIPSLTAPTFLIAVGSIAAAVTLDRNRYVAACAGAALLWLFLLELPPLKIVGSMRYVLPVVVYVLLAAGVACSTVFASRSRLVGTGLGLAALVASSYAGFAYVANMGAASDTRAAALRYLDEKHISNFVVDYWIGRAVTVTRDYRDIAGADYLVSLRWERFLRGGGLREQDALIYFRANLFRCLDGHVAAEFSKLWGDYAYVAPTVRIYDLRKAKDCLPEPSTAPAAG
jgi:hypothetical protein